MRRSPNSASPGQSGFLVSRWTWPPPLRAIHSGSPRNPPPRQPFTPGVLQAGSFRRPVRRLASSQMPGTDRAAQASLSKASGIDGAGLGWLRGGGRGGGSGLRWAAAGRWPGLVAALLLPARALQPALPGRARRVTCWSLLPAGWALTLHGPGCSSSPPLSSSEQQ